MTEPTTRKVLRELADGVTAASGHLLDATQERLRPHYPHLAATLNAARRRLTAYGLELLGYVTVLNGSGLLWESCSIDPPNNSLLTVQGATRPAVISGSSFNMGKGTGAAGMQVNP